ncbi:MULTISPECIES: Lrp/AsnC family transcriptional regulator [unclassified Streptomyces]|uniref:Lrp/AsnC family transcriptional regulator n=1 Tax=unclassified Streptomyces TaxID=2593676 RepID=UPI00093EC7BD|nr:Lrp/AsnC family transcriptional regulator [Streptomyces sp. TSRI0281]OKI35714.1 ArsR family transcriptional regulator [Streptomyces sp. TSRI0281]
MPVNQRLILDVTDNAILQLLQADGRMTTAELARAISMSASSTADRVRRLTDLGAIQGYRAVIDPAALGYTLTAFVRLRLTTPAGKQFFDLLDCTPQIMEAHHVTGEDCFLLKVIARSMPDLEDLTNRLATFGHVTTNLAFRSPVRDRAIPPSADGDDLVAETVARTSDRH